MPKREKPTKGDSEKAIRDTAKNEAKRKDDAVKGPEVAGLPEDIDDIDVIDLTRKTLTDLKAWRDTLDDAHGKGDATNAILNLKKYVETFAEEHMSTEEKDKNEAKAAELEAKFGPEIAKLIHAEYNHEFIGKLTLMKALAEDRADIAHVLNAMAHLMNPPSGVAEGAMKFTFDEDTELAAELTTRYGDETKAREMMTAMNRVVAQPRHPFHEHAQTLLDAHEGDRVGKRDLVNRLHTEERHRSQRLREILEVVDEILPAKPKEITHEKPSSLEGINWSDHHKLLEDAASGEINGDLMVRDLRGKLTERKFFNLVQKEQGKTYYERYQMKEYGQVTIGEGPEEERVAFSMQVQRGVIYEYVRRGDEKGTLGRDGAMTWNERDFDIIAVPRHNWRLDTLVKAEDMLECLTKHSKVDESDSNIIHTLKAMPDGEVKVLSLTKREYNEMVESAQTATEDFRATLGKIYRKAGANTPEKVEAELDKLRAKQRHEQYIETREAKATSWLEQQYAFNGLNNVMRNLTEGGLPPGIVGDIGDMQEAMLRMQMMHMETQDYYGSSSKYEMLARQNLYSRGLSESDATWPDALSTEVNRISIEMAQRDHILAELSSEVQRKFNGLQLIKHVEGKSPAENEIEETRQRQELADLLRNIDYNFEMRLYARLSMLTVDSSGAHIYDSYDHALTTVRNKFEPLLRKAETNTALADLETTRERVRNHLPDEIHILHEHADTAESYIRNETRALTNAAEEYANTIRGLRSNAQRLLDEAARAEAEESFGFDRGQWMVEIDKILKTIESVHKGTDEGGVNPVINAAETLTELIGHTEDEAVAYALEDLTNETWVGALDYYAGEMDIAINDLDPNVEVIIATALTDIENISITPPPLPGEISNVMEYDVRRYGDDYTTAIRTLELRMEDIVETPLELNAEDRAQLAGLQKEFTAIYRPLSPLELQRLSEDRLQIRAPQLRQRIEAAEESLHDTTYAAQHGIGLREPLEFANQFIAANS